jgi:hypothetical protein
VCKRARGLNGILSIPNELLLQYVVGELGGVFLSEVLLHQDLHKLRGSLGHESLKRGVHVHNEKVLNL